MRWINVPETTILFVAVVAIFVIAVGVLVGVVVIEVYGWTGGLTSAIDPNSGTCYFVVWCKPSSRWVKTLKRNIFKSFFVDRLRVFSHNFSLTRCLIENQLCLIYQLPPCTLGILTSADFFWKRSDSPTPRTFHGNSYTAPIPSIHTIQQLGLAISKSYSSLLTNATRTFL